MSFCINNEPDGSPAVTSPEEIQAESVLLEDHVEWHEKHWLFTIASIAAQRRPPAEPEQSKWRLANTSSLEFEL